MNDFPAEYVALIGGCAVKEDGDANEYCFESVSLVQRLIRCGICRHWVTGIAYETTGKCKHSDHEGLICNANFFCGYGVEK